MIGKRLGRFEIRQKLGAGGMGEVYLAFDTQLERHVAIKVLRPEILSDPAAKTRFLREARTVAALSHPNIATLYDAGEADGRPYLAMEYVQGRSLKDEIAGLDPRRALDYTLQIAAALEHAHHRGVVHRDLKPANVMVGGEGAVKLLDFGLAKLVAADEETRTGLTVPGTFIGTLAYAPPEVLAGREADFCGDIYSFGVMLYEMACGALPFAGLEGVRLVSAILQGEAPPVGCRNPAVDPGLGRLIERAMAARPENRPASAGELLAALRGLASGAVPAASASAAAPVLAVLEFENISGDPAADWLGTGLAETLTADLKKVSQVRVVSRERVQQAQRRLAAAGSLAQIGSELGARWIVTGSFQRAGHRLRITPRLLEASSGETLATAKVDGNWEDIFELQDRVVHALLEALEVDLDSGARRRIASPETRQLEAYEHYAQGRQKYYEFGKGALEEARRHYERAVELDPNYALAYSGLGATHAMRFIHRTDPDDLSRARGCLERALELDPELGEPYTYLCYVHMRQGNAEESLKAGHRGVERQPDLLQAPYFLGSAYLVFGELGVDYFQRAVKYLLDATHVEPRWGFAWANLGWIAIQAGDYDQAEHFLSRGLELERGGEAFGSFVGTEMLLGGAWLRRRDWDQASRWYDQAIQRLAAVDHMYRETVLALSACGIGDARLRQGDLSGASAEYRRAWRTIKEFPRMMGGERAHTRALAALATTYAAQGDSARGREMAEEAAERLDRLFRQPQSWVWEAATPQLCHCLAAALLRLGDSQGALDLLARAVEKGWRDAGWLEADPELSGLRQQPRFRELVETVRRLPPIRF